MTQQSIKSRGSVPRWTIIVIYLLATILSAFWQGSHAVFFLPIILVFTIFIAACLNGIERYSLKNLVVFFIITWLVSHFFEAFSIQTGFPFGHYYYDKLAGPRLFQVPLIIMLAYFGTGYASWMLAHIVSGQYGNRLAGTRLFLIPFTASFIMVMWDLCMDPLASTVDSLWVWKEGGVYFGVPLQNYFGWFLVVYIIYQIFAFYIAKYDVVDIDKKKTISTKGFWREVVAIYAIQGFTQIIDSYGPPDHLEIYRSMALISVFTMMFVAFISYLKINNTEHLQ